MDKNKNDDKIRKDMEKAQELIKKKKFDDARAILITIDHPTAEKWLDKINQMSPLSSPMGQTLVVEQKKKPGCLQNVVSAIVLLFICAIIYSFVNPKGASGSPTQRATSANHSTPRGNATHEPIVQPTDSPTDTPELGSRGNPYPAGTSQDVRDGTLIVNGIQRDMTSEVKSMNMFNAVPDSGQEWVLVDITFSCSLGSEDTCNTGMMQFELVGSLGQAYNQEIVAVLDHAFGSEVFGGGQTTGSLGFIVESNDSGLMLVLNDFGRKFFTIP